MKSLKPWETKTDAPLKSAFSQNSLGAYPKQLKSALNHYGVNLSSRVSIVCQCLFWPVFEGINT